MHEINALDNAQQPLPSELDHLFAQLASQDVEQFYRSYRLWSIQRDMATIQTQIGELQQQIEHNAQRMQSVQPSPIALSALAQLQSYGIKDIDLLDRMLEQGDSWLDHTVQLLVRCEELGVIRGDYRQWCENALEGAYDWIATMDQATPAPATSESFDENIEVALLQKLMSEDDTELREPINKASTNDSADQDISLPADHAEHTSSAAEEQTNTDTISQSERAAESDIVAEQHIVHGTAEAIDHDDLKVPFTIQEEDSNANPSDLISEQSADAINQVSVPSNLHDTTVKATEGTAGRQPTESIDHDQNALETNLNAAEDQHKETISHIDASTETTEDTITTQQAESIDHIDDSAAEASFDSNISTELSITIDSSLEEATGPTASHAEQQENDREEQAAVHATVTTEDSTTTRTVNNSEAVTEQTEPITEHTTTEVYLQDDELALPPVTNADKPGITGDEPVVSRPIEQPEQTPQTTTTPYNSGISWSDEPIEPHPAPTMKQSSLLIRLFHYRRNKSNNPYQE
jgi:hypothetical protein